MRDEFVVAMAYVPWQKFGTVYDTDRALEVGTIFPELDKPFMPGRRMGRR
ncbi:MAG: spore coat associated protein CotJA [Roseburia sp.]|nr:spore coat associated protein CotJA [Roseburia sp.]